MSWPLRQATAFDDLCIALLAFTQGPGQGILIALFQPVFTAYFQRIHTYLSGYFVDMTFQGKEALRNAIATEGTGRG